MLEWIDALNKLFKVNSVLSIDLEETQVKEMMLVPGVVFEDFFI